MAVSTEIRKIGVGDIAYVDYTSPGGRAVKSVGWVDVRALGAVGDGVTDDTAAFEAAWDLLAAAGGGDIYFPRGTYLLNAVSKTSGDNITLSGTGWGSAIHFNNAATGLSLSGVSNITIENLKFAGTSRRGVRITDGSFIHVRRCSFSGATMSGTDEMAGLDFFAPNSDVWVEDNYFTGNGDGSENSSYDFTAYPNGATPKNERFHIRGNRVLSTNTRFCLAMFNCHDSDAVGNDVDQGNHGNGTSSGYGIAFYGAAGQANYRNKAIGNHVRNCNGNGIYYALQSEYLIANNTVIDTGKGQSNSSEPVAGICVNSVSMFALLGLYDNGVILGNKVNDSGCQAICVADGRFVVISDNVCDHAATRTGAGIVAPTGIYIRTGTESHNITIRGNIVRRVSNGAGGGTAIFSYCGGVANSNKNITVSGNIVDTCQEGIDLQDSINGKIIGNVVTNISGTPITSNGTNLLRFGNTTAVSGGGIQGRAVLVGGTVTVSTAEVGVSASIVLTRVLLGGTPGHLSVGTIVAGTSFVINSSSGSDTSTVYWEIKK